jgi:hypothetical protein
LVFGILFGSPLVVEKQQLLFLGSTKKHKTEHLNLLELPIPDPVYLSSATAE